MKYRFRYEDLSTPAFIYDESAIVSACHTWEALHRDFGVGQLFPLKCHNVDGMLAIIANYVDGFATNSLFDAQLAREVLGDGKKVHFTSPSLRDNESEALLSLCDGISFNSLSKWVRFKDKLSGRVTCGLRLDPQIKFVQDERYDHCRSHSKLGVPPTGFS